MTITIEYMFHFYMWLLFMGCLIAWVGSKATKIGYLLKFVWKSNPQGALIAQHAACKKMKEKYSDL